jgi:hypothetical protein
LTPERVLTFTGYDKTHVAVLIEHDETVSVGDLLFLIDLPSPVKVRFYAGTDKGAHMLSRPDEPDSIVYFPDVQFWMSVGFKKVWKLIPKITRPATHDWSA